MQNNNNDQTRRPDQQQGNPQQTNPGQQNQQGQDRDRQGQGQPGQGVSEGVDTGAIQPGKTSQGDDANR
ncbi:hypothetical protein [Caulobacter sp. NIBR2454]|uniref:hypothetical protein n=1 Tax=Caulobacter sp. NIBR2454 TaxID=3015996 RepID=UPI0022B716E0|nr:hypothetical protein [Caulobacter sp. NIBR2454]